MLEKIVKKILKEYVGYSFVKFEVINNLNSNEIKLINESKSDEKIKLARKNIIQRLKNINPFLGEFLDRKTNEKKYIKFRIFFTDHFIERLFRKDDPKYSQRKNIVNPGSFEGIDILYFNRDRLAEEIIAKRIKNNDVVKVTDKNGNHFQMLVAFKMDKDENVIQSVGLKLINQIKGEGTNFFDFNRELKLYQPKQ
jgi:hypothetical protein